MAAERTAWTEEAVHVCAEYRENRIIRDGKEAMYLSFPVIERSGFAGTAFTTRIGGAGTGPYRGVNLRFNSRDSRENVLANFETAASFLGKTAQDVVLSMQTHTNNVRVVTEEDRGRGVTRERNYTDVDALVTDVPGIVLCTLPADCTPLIFADPVRRAVGASHAGWRGSALGIAERTVRVMEEAFGSRPEDIQVAIGPVISVRHYEVGPEVAEEFFLKFGEEACRENAVILPGEGDRSFLDLARANRLILERAGVLPQNIVSCGLCTYENPDLFYSHRYVRGGERGTMGSLVTIWEE